MKNVKTIFISKIRFKVLKVEKRELSCLGDYALIRNKGNY